MEKSETGAGEIDGSNLQQKSLLGREGTQRRGTYFKYKSNAIYQ